MSSLTGRHEKIFNSCFNLRIKMRKVTFFSIMFVSSFAFSLLPTAVSLRNNYEIDIFFLVFFPPTSEILFIFRSSDVMFVLSRVM